MILLLFRSITASAVVMGVVWGLPLAAHYWQRGRYFASFVEILIFAGFVGILALTWLPACRRFLQNG